MSRNHEFIFIKLFIFQKQNMAIFTHVRWTVLYALLFFNCAKDENIMKHNDKTPHWNNIQGTVNKVNRDALLLL